MESILCILADGEDNDLHYNTPIDESQDVVDLKLGYEDTWVEAIVSF